MKKKYIYSLFTCLLLLNVFFGFAQDAAVIIDGRTVILKPASSLPYWLTEGQSIAPSSNVAFLSAIEFENDASTSALRFLRVLKIESVTIVPAGKVFKIEAIAFDTIQIPTNGSSSYQIPLNSISGSAASQGANNLPILYQSPKKYSSPGTYQFVVPPGVTNICIELWGGGGNGTDIPGSIALQYATGGGGGGAGGYGYQCFTVVPGSILIVNVGSQGETSNVSGLISASGGANGAIIYQTFPRIIVAGGVGGTSSATFNVSGVNGQSSQGSGSLEYLGGKGGNAYNGGLGGRGAWPWGSAATNGEFPGGGGGGSTNGNGAMYTGGKGADGQVIIYW